MNVTDVTGWTDVNPDSRFRNAAPNVIITADEIANGEYDGIVGDDFNGGFERDVVYDDGTTKYFMTLTLYVHPVGAGALSIDPAAAAATNHNGRLLGEDGAMVQDAEDVQAIAGAMLSHYAETTSEIGSSTTRQPVWSTSLAEGDAIWLVRRGYYELKSGTGAIAAGDRLVADTNVTHGFVRTSVSTIASQAQIQEVITGYGGKCVGIAVNADGAAHSMVLCKLDLPERMAR